MKSQTLYADDKVKWLVFGRDETKPEKIIDTNQYMIIANGRSLLMDPGGIELFALC